jgi:hypothetical protein
VAGHFLGLHEKLEAYLGTPSIWWSPSPSETPSSDGPSRHEGSCCLKPLEVRKRPFDNAEAGGLIEESVAGKSFEAGA